MAPSTASFDLAELLRNERARIVSRFVNDVQRKELPPPGISRSLLIDHIPKFLDEIVTELTLLSDVRASQDAIDTSRIAREHGEQRWSLGYDLDSLIREYGILRHSIIETVKESGGQLAIDEFDILAKCLSVGVAQAASAYIKYRDGELNAQQANLEFLAEAGQLLTSSLDYRSTLARLTRIIVPRLADCCVVHLDDGSPREIPIAHVNPSMVETVREIYGQFFPPGDSPDDPARVARTREPQLIRDIVLASLEAAARSPAHLELLRRLNPSSVMSVPLLVQGNVIGALVFVYSDSQRHYTDQDLVLVVELARRAAVAIDNARLYDSSQKERSRAEAATRAKDEFVAVLSHELRTPLSAILGWVRVMRTASLSNAKRDHALSVIERNANAQGKLLGDLLDLSKIIAGSMRLNPSQVDVVNVVEMAIEGIRPAADAKRVRISAALQRADAVMRADGDRLQQVVWNLLTNAVKFAPKDGTIDVVLRRVNSDVELTVQDDGEGIPADFLPHVFESFRQSEAGARSHGGLGVGLSVAKHLVELHGGSIEARSPGPGQGATFVVRLPISPLVPGSLAMSRVSAIHPSVDNPPLPTGLHDIRVLVVEDETDARDLVVYVLETCGMEVRSAATVVDALRELESYTPHVVVSDIGMAGEDGYSLIRSIRTLPNEEKKGIAAIALTALARNEDRTRALTEGFNLHLVKPIEPAALVRAVVELAGAASRREQST